MPELPDVEVFKQYLDATSLHQRIEEAEVRTSKILEGSTAQAVSKRLRGRRFESSRRHGKNLFARMDDGNWLLFHFGMSGRLVYFKDMEKDPPYDRLLITFSNGRHLAYDSQRMLGEVGLVEDVDEYVKGKGLGPDVLDDRFDFARFQKAIGGRSARIKSALMDQQGLAGIGNVYSDEILFQAGIHPKTKAGELDEKTLKRLFNRMKTVLETTIRHRADPSEFPRTYITPHRKKDGKCPKCGAGLEREKVAGRTAYYCPRCQPGR